jgi:methionyl-tRNA synthetase
MTHRQFRGLTPSCIIIMIMALLKRQRPLVEAAWLTRPCQRTMTQRFASLGPVGTPATSFDDGIRPFQITTPIYYVNDKPHIGHAYTSTGTYVCVNTSISCSCSKKSHLVCSACDVIARYMRLSGRPVFFVSGTDEHGQKVQQSAQAQNLAPQDFCDAVSQQFRDLLQLLNIETSTFVRTTQPSHIQAVQHLWQILVDRDYIYLGTYQGWYSVRDECFYSESELVDGRAPTGAEVVWIDKEQSYFFKLSAFQQPLLDLYEQYPDMIAPESRKNEVISFIKSGLRDLSISRTSFSWGIPVPIANDNDDDTKHIMYVWIDALTNYISALGYPHDEKQQFATYWPASLHVVGKDILRFHAVYWPAFLMAADLPVPRRIFAHGWWTRDGQKISKSIGNVIDPLDLVSKVSPLTFCGFYAHQPLSHSLLFHHV